MYEKTIIVGFIGNAESKVSAAGNTYITISVGVNRGSKENKKTNWYSVLLFGQLAREPEKILRVLRKGRQVLCEGRLQVDTFVRNDNTSGVELTLIASCLPVALDSNRPERQSANQN